MTQLATRFTTLLFSLCLAGAAHAGGVKVKAHKPKAKPAKTCATDNYCDATCAITIPKLDGSAHVAIEKLWFKPYISNTTFATTNETQPGVKRINIDSDYDMAFRVEAGFTFPCTGNDLTMAYEHHDYNNSKRVYGVQTAAQRPSALAPTAMSDDLRAFELAADANGADLAKGSYDLEQHLLDMELGQAINLGKRLTMRLHSGFRYLDSETRFKSNILLVAMPDAGDILTAKFSSDFDGIGPRVGMDCIWHVGHGFDVISKISTSMLIGDIYNKTTLSFIDASNQTNNTNRTYKSHNDDCVVANIDMRIGARYTMVVGTGSEIGLELGYQARSFFVLDNKAQPIFDLDDNAPCNACDIAEHGIYIRADMTI